MSATAPKVVGEPASSMPVFSYAQAAKGQTPLHTSSASSSVSNSTSAEPTPRSASTHRPGASEESDGSEITRRASEAQLTKASVEGSDLSSSVVAAPAADTSKEMSSSNSQSGSEPPHQQLQSAPPSPVFGSTSTSTVLKEDDASATPNGSSESTWDKISQTSQNVEKLDGKADGDDEDMKLSTWEHVPAPATLKEAPPPAFNIWEKRKMDQQAKVTKDSKSSQSPSIANNKDSPQDGKKTQDDLPDLGRLDGKKRPRPGQVSDDKSTSPTAREGGKLGDGRYKSQDDGDGRNVIGGRTGENQKLATPSMSPLPPPRDTMSWPTPDNAQGEERKKVHERGEKSEKEKTPAKLHGKEKWVPVPFVPTPVFNTPLPLGRRGGGRGPRGSRDGSGGRGGHIPHGSISGTTATEKPSTSGSGAAVVTPLAGADRSRRVMGPPPRPGQSIQKPKRAVSAGPPAVREQQRKVTDPLLHERNGESLINEPRQTQDNQTVSTENRRASTATQTDTPQHTQQLSPVGSRNDNHGPKRQFQSQNDRDNGSQISSADHAHPRSGPERRTEGSMRAPENSRDYNGIPHTRDRGDGRPERGRGGFRGRGGYNGFGSTHSTNGQTIQGSQSNQPASSGFSSSKSQSFNERHPSQPQVAPFVPRERGHRSNSRSQSIPNATGFGRFTNGGPPPAAQHLPALQTDLANMYGYQPGHPAIMSAMPYQPYIEQMQLIGMVQIQMEYYFSVDNLCKDMFLRKHMDSQGFVLLTVLTNFNRIRQLTSDIDLIRYVCRMSTRIDIQTGVDGHDRVRKAEGWEQWILGIEEREPTARNETPVSMQQAYLPQLPTWDPSHTYTHAPMLSSSAIVSPRSSGPPGQTRVTSVSTHSMNGTASAALPSASESIPNGYITNGHVSQTPLSAAVPDFTPGLQPLSNSTLAPLESSHALPPNSFSDEQVENLKIVIRKPHSSPTSTRVPFPSAASRTFSNGSIDGSTLSAVISDLKDRRQASSANGEFTTESREKELAQRPRSPLNHSTASKPPHDVPSPVFWVKDLDTPIDDLPSDLTHAPYTVFRHEALESREQSSKGQCHRDMDILYQFWSHFLIRNFNIRMYEEFRRLALEDFDTRGTSVGLRNLVMYYDESILGHKVIPDNLALDYVNLVKMEGSGKERMAFDRLRAAWRNGALNLKNRVKIDKILDVDLKAELER